MLTLFEQALVLHLIGDWVLQNHWMAEHKPNLRHPAAWVHAAIHVVLMSIVLGPIGGLVLGIAHMIIDSRQPFQFWRDRFGMTSDGPVALHVAIWSDQVLHIICIAIWIQFVIPRL